MRVDYIDVLFAVNAVIDYILLSLTMTLTGQYSPRLRLALASILGGAIAVVMFFVPFRGAAMLMLRVSTCSIMTLAAFRYKDSETLIRGCLTLFLVSAALAGAVSAAAPAIAQSRGGAIYMNISLKVLLLGSAITYWLISSVVKPSAFTAQKRTLPILTEINGVTLHITALVDTGNRLIDPISRKKIIVTDKQTVMSAFSGAEYEALKRLNAENAIDCFSALSEGLPGLFGITTCGTALGTGLMLTLKPHRVTVDGADSGEYILGIGINVDAGDGCRAVIGV